MAKAYGEDLEKLYRWTKKQVNTIPRSQRYLATAHAAFGYFCKEFGFKALPVQGLTKERSPKPHYLAETINLIRTKNIPAVFPENSANPKVLSAMVKETGVRLGGTLLADAPSEQYPTYLDAYRYNVNTIVGSLQTTDEQ